MAADYRTMIDRIAEEIRRHNMGAHIRRAIQSAIQHYEGEHFFFNEARATATTVRGQNFYTLPVDFVYTVGKEPLTIVRSGRAIDMEQREWDHLQQVDDGVQQGPPSEWAYFEEQFRLWPIPDSEYTLTLAYVKRLTALNLDTDTNAWVTDAEELIRARAKADLYLNVIHDFEKAGLMGSVVEMAQTRLKNMTGRKKLSGKLTASYL